MMRLFFILLFLTGIGTYALDVAQTPSIAEPSQVVQKLTEEPKASAEPVKTVQENEVVEATEPTPVAPTEPAPVITDQSEAEAKAFIYAHESGNIACKINGGAIDCSYDGDRACGIGQALPCQKLTSVCALIDYNCQDNFFTTYMVNRYGTWVNAKMFWEAHRWW
jgi:hypothetical protein